MEFVRAIPLLPMLFWVFYGLPVVLKSMGLNIPIDPFWGAILTLAISDSAFTAEIYRGGIQSIEKGQTEAAKSVGLKQGLILRLIIIPQALRIIVPPLTNQYLNLTKNSSLAAAIAYPDLVLVFAGTALMQTGQAIEIIGMVMGVYLFLSLVTSIFMNIFNRYMKTGER